MALINGTEKCRSADFDASAIETEIEFPSNRFIDFCSPRILQEEQFVVILSYLHFAIKSFYFFFNIKRYLFS